MKNHLRVEDVDTSANPLPTDISVSSPTGGVAMVDVKLGVEESPAPKHWRVGDWNKPPLDISLNNEGLIQNIQIVLQDESVAFAKPASQPPANEEAGLPSFNVDQWPSDRYLDARSDVTVVRSITDELVVRIGKDQAERVLRVGRSLRLGLGEVNDIVSVFVGPLDADSWRLVAEAATSLAPPIV